MPEDNAEWMKGNCTCANFLKTYMCKHLLGIALRLKFCEAPPAAKTIMLGQKRKRGRVSKAANKKALLIK